MLTDEQLKGMSKADLYQLRLRINNYITQYEQAALDALNLGIPVEDYDLKQGRIARAVLNEKDLVDDLTQQWSVPFGDLYVSKLIGVPAIEKLSKKLMNHEDSIEFYNKHIKETRGKPTLVFTGSKGEADNG